MAKLLQEYTTVVASPDGTNYLVRSYGDERSDGTWIGWIEFHPTDLSRPVLKTNQETSQPNQMDVEYWATGLTPVYLEGALDRALNPLTRATPAAPVPPLFDGPARASGDRTPVRESVLNPFSVYRKGESLLRNQLSALSGWHLVNIIEAYGLSEQDAADLEATPEPVLVELIVSAVQKRTLADVGRGL